MHSRLTMLGLLLLLLPLLGASGCGKTCAAGATRACACAGNSAGVQSCADDGQRWLACKCGAAEVAPVKKSGRAAVDPSPPPPGPTPEGMIFLPAGSFEMGSESGDDDEKPVHRVTLAQGFFLDKTEVTVAAYKACVDADGCLQPGTHNYCNWGVAGRDDHPVNCVDWGAAYTYCRWAGKSLPSEAQWEYAARSGGRSGHVYPWGSEAASCERAVMSDGGYGCGKNSTWSVCSKAAGHSAQGVCDLAGNVWEWVADDYGPYALAASDGQVVNNVKGVGFAKPFKVLRGGSWGLDDESDLRAAFRFRSGLTYDANNVGFRCARTL